MSLLDGLVGRACVTPANAAFWTAGCGTRQSRLIDQPWATL